jgi:hypothetical protein
LLEHLEHLIEAADLLFRLFEMVFESPAQVPVGGLIDHLGQRFHDLVLGIENILQAVHEKIVHRLDVFAEEAHGIYPSKRC